MFKAKIVRIGGSIGIIIPNSEVEFNAYEEGDWFEINLKKIKNEIERDEK